MRSFDTPMDSLTTDPARRRAVRVYSYQKEFSRGVQSMQRSGWRLQTFHQVRSPQAVDLIQGSAPGFIPLEARQQIVAHFVCATARNAGLTKQQRFRRRLAISLMRAATWLDRPERCTTPA